MRNYRLPVSYVLLTVATGALMQREVLLPLALGISLFIPALCYLVAKDSGVLVALLLSAISIGAISLLIGWKSVLDLSTFSFLGILVRVLKGKFKTEDIVLVLSLFSFAITLIEEFFISFPPEIERIRWIIQLRWGLYFLSSVVISAISVGIISMISKDNFKFKKIKFGFWVVPVFLIFGFFSLFKWVPEVQLIGANALVGISGLFIVQGFAVFSYYIGKFSPIVKTFTLLAIALLPSVAIVMAGLSGIFDFWFDFRKLKGGNKDEGDSA